MRRFDVAVAGGGPSGAMAALLLARAGARVVLVALPGGRSRIEGVSPRVAALMAAHGLPVEALGPALPRRADWGASGVRNREHCVDRAELDALLRAAAAAAGVSVLAARALRPDGARGRLRTEAGEVAAGVLVEARGRQASAGAKRVRGPATTAIAGFTAAGGRSGTAIAARPSGWTWRAAGADGRGWTQVVVDSAAIRGAGLAGAWAAVEPALPMPAAPVVRAAELRLNAPELPPRTLVLGDAAVAMDPLSGHGLYWAFSSALAAVPMARAVLDGEGALACRFHRERVVATFWRQARIGRDFHRAVAGDDPFWTARRAWPDVGPAHAPVERPAIHLRVIVADGRLVEGEVVVTAQEPDGVAFVAGRPIGPILHRLGRGPLPDARAFHAHVVPEAEPAAAALIHGWLATRGFGGQLAATSHDQEVPQ